MKIGNLSIFREKAGVISENVCWIVIWHNCMYDGDSLVDLIKNMVRYYKHRSTFVGF